MTQLINHTIRPTLAISIIPGMPSIDDIYARTGPALPRRLGHRDITKKARGWSVRITVDCDLMYVEPTAERNEATFAELWRISLDGALRTGRWPRTETLRGLGDAQMLDRGRPVPLWKGEMRDYVFLNSLGRIEGQELVDFGRVKHMTWGNGWALIPTTDLLARLLLSAGEEGVVVNRVPTHLRGKPVFVASTFVGAGL